MNDEDKIIFGRSICKYRETLNKTQEQLAEEAGISITYLSLIETGVANPKTKVIIAILNALNITYIDCFQKDLMLTDLVAREILNEFDILPDVWKEYFLNVLIAINKKD